MAPGRTAPAAPPARDPGRHLGRGAEDYAAGALLSAPLVPRRGCQLQRRWGLDGVGDTHLGPDQERGVRVAGSPRENTAHCGPSGGARCRGTSEAPTQAPLSGQLRAWLSLQASGSPQRPCPARGVVLSAWRPSRPHPLCLSFPSSGLPELEGAKRVSGAQTEGKYRRLLPRWVWVWVWQRY